VIYIALFITCTAPVNLLLPLYPASTSEFTPWHAPLDTTIALTTGATFQ